MFYILYWFIPVFVPLISAAAGGAKEHGDDTSISAGDETKLGAFCKVGPENQSLRIQVCPKQKGLQLHSYFKDQIGTLNPVLERSLDS